MTSSTDRHKSGIYGIYCKVNGKWYVGQAKNITRRNQEERRELNAGTCHNKHLQHAWNKYGAQSFDWVVLFDCPVADLDHWETVWIERLNSFAAGFNKTLGGGGARGFKHTPEWKEQASARNRDGKSPRKGRPISVEAKVRMRANALGGKSQRAEAVYQLTRGWIMVRRFDSIADAERATGLSGAHISEVCSGKRHSTGGYVWVKEADYEQQKTPLIRGY